VKFRVSNGDEERRFASPKRLSGAGMAKRVLAGTADWTYDAVSVGIPAQVHGNRVVHDPVNLGKGWIAVDYAAAFGKPTRVVNDASMQAIGSYRGGRMLFLGLGTGLGSTFIVDYAVEPMELGHLPYKQRTYEEYVGTRGRERLGRKRWQKAVADVVEIFRSALEPDEVVLGGGAVDDLDDLPLGARRGDNEMAFAGGFRLWSEPARFVVP
jgi:polyphosphate glucokinase